MPKNNSSQSGYSSSSSSSTAQGSGSGKDYIITYSGTNSQGNHYCNRFYGSDVPNPNSYHYSNANGSYYYSNPNGSTYYNDGKGYSVYRRDGAMDNSASSK